MKNLLWLLFISVGTFSYSAFAQLTEEINQDELGNVTDAFQELFFKAIAQRATENHEQAIQTLLECQALNPSEAVVFVELGKNYEALKNYFKAEENYQKAIEKLQDEQKISVQLQLLEVLKNQKKYEQAIPLAENLIAKGENLHLDLIEILMQMRAYSSALQQIEKLEEEKGTRTALDNYREAIYITTKNYTDGASYFTQRIEKNPQDEDAYFRLIGMYRLQENNTALIETAKALEKINPLQDQLDFIFSMVYLQENQGEEAFKYSKKVLENNALDEKVKTQTIQSLKAFVEKNPSFQEEFLNLLNLAIAAGKSAASNEEQAAYYLNKDEAKSLSYYKKALEDQPNNFELYQKVLVLQLSLERYDEALQTAEEALEVFPAQAVFYYHKARSLRGLTQYEQAISVIKEGLEYVFETSPLEVDILSLGAKVYSLLGDKTNSENFQKRALDAKQSLENPE